MTDTSLRTLEREAAAGDEGAKALLRHRRELLGKCPDCGAKPHPEKPRHPADLCWPRLVDRRQLPTPTGGGWTWRDVAKHYVMECMRRVPAGSDYKATRRVLTKLRPIKAGQASWIRQVWQQECRRQAGGSSPAPDKRKRKLAPKDPRQGSLFGG